MTDKKNAGKSAAGTQEPEKPAAGTQESKISASDIEVKNQITSDKIAVGEISGVTLEIQTVEDLEVCYPQLVSEIRDEVIEQVGKCTAKKVKENMPELYERIVTELQSRGGPNLNVPGFLLELDDPFAEGTLRTYMKLKGIGGLRLPHVLPYKDKKTRECLENYALRAGGAGDTQRTDAAIRAMEKI